MTWPRSEDDPDHLTTAQENIDQAIDSDQWPRPQEEKRLEQTKPTKEPAKDTAVPEASGSPPTDAPGQTIRTWERTDKGRACFLCSRGGGPSWGVVTKREAFDLNTGELIASEEVTKDNRNTNRA